MFPHLKERVIITTAALSSSSSSDHKIKVADNIAIVNGTDLSPILERSDIKKVSFQYSLITIFLLRFIVISILNFGVDEIIKFILIPIFLFKGN